MEFQNIINLLDNTNNQLSNFMTKNWVGVNDEACGVYNTNSQIKIVSNLKYDRYQRGLSSDRSSNPENPQFANEFHNPINKRFKMHKV